MTAKVVLNMSVRGNSTSERECRMYIPVKGQRWAAWAGVEVCQQKMSISFAVRSVTRMLC